MSILIKIEEFFRKRKINNRYKIFKEVQQVLASIDERINGSDAVVYSLSICSDYETMQFTLDKIFKTFSKIDDSKKKEYKNLLAFLLYIRFALNFHGGYLGILWI